MQWASTVSSAAEIENAVTETATHIHTSLGGTPPDLAVVFVSEHHQARYPLVSELIRAALRPRVLLGCSAGGVIGGGREIEGAPGFSLTAALLPGVEILPFHLSDTPSSDLPPPTREPQFLLLPDPFSFDTDSFLQHLDQTYPGSAKVGGLASAARQPGGNALFLDEQVYDSGLVGVALTGNITIDTIVAQGCRPIGDPMFVTACDQSLLRALDGRPAVEVLHEVFMRLPAADKELARNSLFLGIVMREVQHEYHHGDFLIRNLMGMDPKTGTLSVGAHLRPGQVVQFHLRDKKTSADDLDALLNGYRPAGPHPAGSLLFSCLGRGIHLYGEPDHDTEAFRRHVGNVPVGGFFCNGEIGPVQGTTFLHGYTSSFGIFRPRVE